MIELDRGQPMEAVHKATGKKASVTSVDQSKALKIVLDDGVTATVAYFDKYGQPKDDYCPWIIRNVQSYARRIIDSAKQAAVDDTIPIDRALWRRVEGLVRGMAESDESWWRLNSTNEAAQREARAIVGLLPAVVDEDLIEARKIAMDVDGYNRHSHYESGKFDDKPTVRAALAAIRKGRELEAGR